ncbi:tripartite tricarboxylate transporter substrate binding protein [Xylanimonas allomyrinae]|uniref:Tripartite tricarboxylate transporter substrate binding protein n=1 Tax=Xylanimonas allomyrinae TaxID=2509459 RepID=A0A4P6EPT2_9MICO|nr:tripartite tricarboxylate transporter substrate-binding protein [Xylanimonas allomyrinae]QAY63823.1 tripartite tricarboxylate transporter substrate binding protein [Xylanimonas allomyrinae]
MRHARTVAAFVAAATLAGCSALSSGDQSRSGGSSDGGASRLSIVVPADPGGGWDQTGRAIQAVLEGEKLVPGATVTNVGGAGGTVGLANIATSSDPNLLLVMGLVMVGAVETNQSQARIEDTTPIARLTEEQEVIAVPIDSPYETIGDLVEAVRTHGKEVTITGGSAGGTDHILAALLLKAAGVAPDAIGDTLNYVAYSGGGESLAALLGHNVDAGVSGVSEYAEQVKAGTLRALAVSGAEREALLPDVPTLSESGYDVELTNWRGVVAPGSIDDAQRERLVALVTDLTKSDAWVQTLEERGWSDAFLAGDAFDTYLQGNIAEIKGVLHDIGLVG